MLVDCLLPAIDFDGWVSCRGATTFVDLWTYLIVSIKLYPALLVTFTPRDWISPTSAKCLPLTLRMAQTRRRFSGRWAVRGVALTSQRYIECNRSAVRKRLRLVLIFGHGGVDVSLRHRESKEATRLRDLLHFTPPTISKCMLQKRSNKRGWILPVASAENTPSGQSGSQAGTDDHLYANLLEGASRNLFAGLALHICFGPSSGFRTGGRKDWIDLPSRSASMSSIQAPSSTHRYHCMHRS